MVVSSINNSINFRARTRSEREAEKKRFSNEEKQYKSDVKDLKETQQIIKDITNADKNTNILAGSTLKKLGTVADILITGTLSGMALHWSTGKAFMMLNSCAKKPKIANFLSDVKKPFAIINTAVQNGAATAWETMAKEVKATKTGKKLLATRPMKAINKGIDNLYNSYKNVKADAKNLTAENIKSGVSTVFGVSGFVAGVVEKLDPQSAKKDK